MRKPEDMLGKCLLAKELGRDTHVCLPEDLTSPDKGKRPCGSLPAIGEPRPEENNVADRRLKLSSNFWSYFEDFVSFSIKKQEEVDCAEIITDELMCNTDQ